VSDTEFCDHLCQCEHEHQDHSSSGVCKQCDCGSSTGHYPSECFWAPEHHTDPAPLSARAKVIYFLEEHPAIQGRDIMGRPLAEVMADDLAYELSQTITHEAEVWGPHSGVGRICAYNAELINPYVKKKPRPCCPMHHGQDSVCRSNESSEDHA
jgi:hypothetical protein